MLGCWDGVVGCDVLWIAASAGADCLPRFFLEFRRDAIVVPIVMLVMQQYWSNSVVVIFILVLLLCCVVLQCD